MGDFLKWAKALAQSGFHVFPLKENSKLPAIKDFPNAATRDVKQIIEWWTNGHAMGNIGISTTKFNGSQALVVVDVDDKGKKKGSEELLKLELEGFEFTPTAEQITPSGGRHLIYKTDKPVKQGESVLGHGLDIRSRGGYIVAAGSKIDGLSYDWATSRDISDCPEWILKKCQTTTPKKLQVEIKDINQERAYSRAKYYLEGEAPFAVQGDGGDETTYKVAATIKDLGLNESLCVDLMLAVWNENCSPPWAPEELEKKVRNAYEYGANSPGVRAPETQFTPVQSEKKFYLDEINESWALVFEDGGHVMLHETIDEKGRPKRIFMGEASFKRKFSPFLVGEGKKQESYADVWLNWEKRREYRGLCFRPELTSQNGYYNLWRGFAYGQKEYAQATPSARLGFDLFVEHVKKNVCENNDSYFNWLMGYFAHLIQKPYERPLTTLVFRGKKGVGKNIMIDRIGKLLGSGHYLVAHNQRYLTSNFNGHLDSCLMLVLDEAFWSGDKSADGVLKGLTTAPEILIERKGKEPYVVDNLVRLVVIGNEDWLVPATADERRYAVFNVGDGRIQDNEFFEKMRILMDEKGGAEVLMHFLKNFDLSKVDINDAPLTAGLFEQKYESLNLVQQFWYDCLVEGKIMNVEFLDKWEPSIDKMKLRRAFMLYARERNIKSWIPNEVHFTRELKKACPSMEANKKDSKEGQQFRVYRFPNLETARAEWDTYIGQSKGWN